MAFHRRDEKLEWCAFVEVLYVQLWQENSQSTGGCTKRVVVGVSHSVRGARSLGGGNEESHKFWYLIKASIPASHPPFKFSNNK